jgi:hypothetical protein
MPNGKPGDHPVTDIFTHHLHRFGGGVEEEIVKLVEEFGQDGKDRLDTLIFTPAFQEAEARLHEQQRAIRELLIDVWNELSLERRRRNQTMSFE